MKVYLGPYKENRKEQIHIHDYDTWNMDDTLAMIILPMLKQLKATKHGVPYMDYEDMPEHLQYISRQYDPRAVGDLFNNWDDFDQEFERQVEVWDWMMDEMIWAFEQILDDDNNNQFYSGESDIYWEKLENGHSEMKRGPKDTFQIDFEGMKRHNARIDNGLKLFGKYYRSLWD